MPNARAATATMLTLLADPSWANTLSCNTSAVTVTYQEVEHADLVCDAVKQASTLFEQCNIPPLANPVHIEFAEEMGEGCVALYHCGDNLIEVLPPPQMQERRKPDGAFAHLNIDDYFRSVVVHELAHAATDDIPCPFDDCVAAAEYVAYAMQVMSLSPDAQSIFEGQSGLDRPISIDELNVMILYMAPNLFSQKVWAHFSQRDDPCGYIAQLVDGSILIDQELP